VQRLDEPRNRYRTDFNRLRKARLSALYGLGGSVAAPAVGEIVELFDGDENSCLAVVERVEPDLIYTRLLRNTWRPGSRLEVVDLMEALKASVRAARQARLPALEDEPDTGTREPSVFELS
jgi:hypothetical protein